MSNVSYWIIQDKAEIRKQVTVTSVAVATTKFLFNMCGCTVAGDVGTGDFYLVLDILHVCGHTHARSHMSPSMDCSGHQNEKICKQHENKPQCRSHCSS